MSDADRALLEKFKNLLKITHNVKQSRVANVFGLSKDQLLDKLLEWGNFLPFKIDDAADLIVVDNFEGFIDALNQQFVTWESQEHGKIDKLGSGESQFDSKQLISPPGLDTGDSVYREAMESLLKAINEVDRLKAELVQKDAEIAALYEKFESQGFSGAVVDKEKLVAIFLETIQKTQRSIRICLPTLSLVESIGLLPIIQGFPRATVVNIAGDIKPTDEHIIMDLKKRGVVFTQYDRKDRWVINRDGEDMVIALEKPDGNIIGFYSNEQKITAMLNSAIMEPWVRGMKI